MATTLLRVASSTRSKAAGSLRRVAGNNAVLARNRVCAPVLGRTLARPVLASGIQLRTLSDAPDSHDDFKTVNKVNADADEEVQKFLGDAVASHDVLLFMKGSPQNPRCGFSARTVAVLQELGVDFSSADVLHSNEIREGIKKFSDWPTIPQLYVSGEFVGGCDVVQDMFSNGELKELLDPILEKQAEERSSE